MSTLTDADIRGNAEAGGSTHTDPRRSTGIVGALLFVLLVFTTTTIFVRAAWPLQCFQIGIYALVGVYLLVGLRNRAEHVAGGVTPWLVYLIPLWGVGQILAHTTTSTFETREEVLRWGALAGVFFLTQIVVRSRTTRDNFLSAFLVFATAMAVLCVTQLFTSEGRVLWIFPTGYPDVFATFQNQNNYAQFVELALPIALWRALREGWRSWWYSLSGGLLYASVIASASRAGAAICTIELLAILALGLVRLHDPFSGRREFLIAAIDMVKHKPLTGYGLGTFPEVYQQHAVKDFPFYANHAHNDWAEFAADGGVPFLLLVLIPFAVAVPTAIRHPWALGLVAVMLHACVDYPFPRPAVSGWMFALLGILYVVRTDDKRLKAVSSATPEFDSST
jgi:hypothetical protein